MQETGDQRSEHSLRQRSENGLQYLERPGTGPALVFLHGIGSNSRSFMPLFKCFPQGPRLIAWDAPGYGSSKPLEAVWPRADDYAIALEQLFDDLGLEEAHIVGHSLGTLIAVAFATRSPSRVTSITLAASAQGYGIGEPSALPDGVAQRLRDLEALGPDEFARARAPRLVFRPERNPSLVADVQTQMAQINPSGYAQAVRMLASGNLSASIAHMMKKPAFIVGAEDQITPIDQTRTALKAWAAAHGDTPDCIIIPGAGHAVYVQAPQAFADALLKVVPGAVLEPQDHPEGELHDG